MPNDNGAHVGKVVFGIDLGTSKSCIAYWNADKNAVEAIPVGQSSGQGRFLIPSLVAWDRDQQAWQVGWAAKEFGWQRPGDLVYSIKRYIGRWFSDPVVEGDYRGLSYTLMDRRSNRPLNSMYVDFGQNAEGQSLQLAPQEISAKVLAQLRQETANHLGLALDDVKYAVITVPTYFGTCQRVATQEAGRLAGLEVVEILNEAIAAALAYEKDRLTTEARRIVVFSLGGGTCEVAVLEVSKDPGGLVFDTLAVDGNVHLGGDDIDLEIVNWLEREIKDTTNQTVTPDNHEIRERLRQEAEAAKIRLSKGAAEELPETTIDLVGLDLGTGPVDLEIQLTQEQLVTCARGVLDGSMSILETARQKAGLQWSQIDEVILVGGQTQMTILKKRIEEATGIKPQLTIQPQLVVGLGAAEYGHMLSQGEERREQNFVGVVLGWSYGIEAKEGDRNNVFSELVSANVPIPLEGKPYPFETVVDGQSEIEVKVFQCPPGTRFTDEQGCTPLGSLRMPIPNPGPAGRLFTVQLTVGKDSTLQMKLVDPGADNAQVKVFEPDQVCLPPSTSR
jgi:molecular chaperone DnaK